MIFLYLCLCKGVFFISFYIKFGIILGVGGRVDLGIEKNIFIFGIVLGEYFCFIFFRRSF